MKPTIIGTSVIGASHIRNNIECQDSYLIIDGKHRPDKDKRLYRMIPDDVKIIAVADGHGSASCPYSKDGSRFAVNEFCDVMAQYVVRYRNDTQALKNLLQNESECTYISKQIMLGWQARVCDKHTDPHRGKTRDIPYTEDNQIDQKAIWKQYGTTLLGLLITNEYVFAFQLGDGDIMFVDGNTIEHAIVGEKILGVETHSISKPDSWKKVITKVINQNNQNEKPFMYILSTDGWVNSHASEEDFQKTCTEYFHMIQQYGTDTIDKNIPSWLSETSEQGCGDDITVICAYFGEK